MMFGTSQGQRPRWRDLQKQHSGRRWLEHRWTPKRWSTHATTRYATTANEVHTRQSRSTNAGRNRERPQQRDETNPDTRCRPIAQEIKRKKTSRACSLNTSVWTGETHHQPCSHTRQTSTKTTTTRPGRESCLPTCRCHQRGARTHSSPGPHRNMLAIGRALPAAAG